jgi:hypothetical protein
MDLPTEKENLFVVLLIRAPYYLEVGGHGSPGAVDCGRALALTHLSGQIKGFAGFAITVV